MSLYTPSTGLFHTHVAWEDVQEDLFRVLGSSAKLGEHKTIKDISDGNGFASRIGLVDPDWAEENTDLPSKFVVKIVTQLTYLDYSDRMADQSNLEVPLSNQETLQKHEHIYKEIHNVEVSIYEKLAELANDAVPILKIFGSRKFSETNPLKGYIIMDYVDNLIPLHSDSTLDKNLMSEILRALANFHSIGRNYEATERKTMAMGIFTDLFGPMLTPEFVKSVLNLFRTFMGEEWNDKIAEFENVTTKFTDVDYRTKLGNTAERLEMKRVLCHGDPWVCNMLFTENDEELHLKSLIDFQTSHFGSAGADLCRLLCGVLSAEDRRANWQTYIEEYYTHLSQANGSSKNMPFTIEQLTESYLQVFPISSFLIATNMSALGPQICNRRSDKEKARSQLMEKIIGLIDDSIFYQKRNENLCAE